MKNSGSEKLSKIFSLHCAGSNVSGSKYVIYVCTVTKCERNITKDTKGANYLAGTAILHYYQMFLSFISASNFYCP